MVSRPTHENLTRVRVSGPLLFALPITFELQRLVAGGTGVCGITVTLISLIFNV